MNPRRSSSSKFSEAFREPLNALGLAGAAALSLALIHPVPLLIAGVLEAVYLLFVPDSRWYDARLSQRYDQEVIARRRKLAREVCPQLSEDVNARFSRLEQLRDQISGQMFEGKRWFQEVLRKLDYLLEKFLLFASKQVQFEQYLRTVWDEAESATSGSRNRIPPFDPTRPGDESVVKRIVERIQELYDDELQSIRDSLPGEENLHNTAVLQKRIEILDRRKQYVERIGEILINLGHQLRLIEDTFGLINDEIRARSPEQVLVDIEDVVSQSGSLSETLDEVSPFVQMPVAPGAGKLYDVQENRT